MLFVCAYILHRHGVRGSGYECVGSLRWRLVVLADPARTRSVAVLHGQGHTTRGGAFVCIIGVGDEERVEWARAMAGFLQ